CAKKDDDFDYW
nr:immunoglobulin heavy chain junction region [Macaca mulatta]MOV89151.1 immunoglobulin heavy chain junction region [Macaca mulatta]